MPDGAISTANTVNIEAEQALLGAILCNNEVLDRVGGLRPDHFFDPLHAEIFRTCRDMALRGDLASPITIKGSFADWPGIEDMGGVAYLARLAGAAISISGAGDYAGVISGCHARRAMLEAMEKAQEALRTGANPEEVAGALEGEIAALGDDNASRPMLISWLKAMNSAIEEINEAYQNEAPTGLRTGIPNLDKIIGALAPGELTILGGRPSMGKSALASSIALNAVGQGGGVIFCSLEMTTTGLVVRAMSELLARDGHEIPYFDLRAGRISEDQFRRVVEKMRQVEDFPILITPPSIQDVSKLRSAIRRGAGILAAKGTPLKLVVFDYLQLADDPSERTVDRISAISKALKGTAMRYGVPVLALSQLSRALESRDNKRPRLSDLRDSGSIEQDADIVLFAYRHEYYLDREKPESGEIEKLEAWSRAKSLVAGKMEIIVAKSRMGAIGTATTVVDLKTNHFRESDEDRQEGMEF